MLVGFTCETAREVSTRAGESRRSDLRIRRKKRADREKTIYPRQLAAVESGRRMEGGPNQRNKIALHRFAPESESLEGLPGFWLKPRGDGPIRSLLEKKMRISRPRLERLPIPGFRCREKQVPVHQGRPSSVGARNVEEADCLARSVIRPPPSRCRAARASCRPRKFTGDDSARMYDKLCGQGTQMHRKVVLRERGAVGIPFRIATGRKSVDALGIQIHGLASRGYDKWQIEISITKAGPSKAYLRLAPAFPIVAVDEAKQSAFFSQRQAQAL